MELRTRCCVSLFGLILLLSSCFLLYEGRKLNGYKFPVYWTKHCPRNQSEWSERSSAINCTEDNGYVCLPNENITALLEFCYIYPFILIQEDICLYLSKRYSAVDSYSCNGFLYGCPNTSHVSYKLFENPECTTIGNGCFLAEPSCQSLTSTRYLHDGTEHNNIENNNNWTLVGITCGVFIFTCVGFLCFLFIKHRKGEGNDKRNTDAENNEEKKLIQIQHNINESRVEEFCLDQEVIEQWQEEDKQFVETKASKEVERLIKCQNIVMVTGHTGSGKSAILHHVALKYRSQGWNVKHVCTVIDMIKMFNSIKNDIDRGTIFVLNDPLGKDSFDEIEYTSWRKYEENIKACLNKTKLLLSCRKYILSDTKVKGLLKDKSKIVDISNDQFKLSTEEKENIFKTHAFDKNVCKRELMEIVQTEAYFPLLCKLYFSNIDKEVEKLRFFKAPVEVLEEEIRNFRISNKEKYCALVLLVLFNNDLCVEDIRERQSGISRKKYKLALELCELKKTTPPHIIVDSFETLQGFFVKKIGDTFQFYHDFVKEVTTFVFGKDYPLLIIKYADIGFLRKRVTLESCNDNSEEFTINLSDRHIDDLGKRLFNDIFGKRLLDVVLNPCLKNKNVINVFKKELNNNPKTLKKLLEKQKLQIDYEETNQTSNHFFVSKISFVGLQERISPLNAIIIFCDASLSLICLKALERMPQYLKENFLLSSVCCNGSKDIFAMFIKDHVRECLSEKWKFLNPIHIASVFNNNEILRELLQVGADVDQKTSNENYWTPLTLAAGNQTEENEDEKKIKSIQSRRNETIELLLSNGADIDLCKENGSSPLYIVCQEGHDNTVKLLLHNGADANFTRKDGTSPLYCACQEGHYNIVQMLLSNGANANLCKENGASPLYIACQEAHDNIVQLLLINGADINKCTTNGASPLTIACHEGHESIVQTLLNSRANIYSIMDDGSNPLFKACQKGHDNTVKLLLQNGADANFTRKDGTSPLYCACQEGHYDIVQILLNNGASVNLCKEDRTSPLYIACQKGFNNVAQLLLKNGANKCVQLPRPVLMNKKGQ